MNALEGTPTALTGALVSVVPEMSVGAPKRNLVVAVSYALLLWVTGARLFAFLSTG